MIRLKNQKRLRKAVESAFNNGHLNCFTDEKTFVIVCLNNSQNFRLSGTFNQAELKLHLVENVTEINVLMFLKYYLNLIVSGNLLDYRDQGLVS